MGTGSNTQLLMYKLVSLGSLVSYSNPSRIGVNDDWYCCTISNIVFPSHIVRVKCRANPVMLFKHSKTDKTTKKKQDKKRAINQGKRNKKNGLIARHHPA